MLFLMAAGLTLVLGVMDTINLAHGSLYMLGAYLAATLAQATGSFLVGVLLAMAATAAIGAVMEIAVLRALYRRDHLSQVLATFALILILNDGVKMIFGTDHVERAVREVDHVHHAEHQREPRGEQEQHQAELQAVQGLLEDEDACQDARSRCWQD